MCATTAEKLKWITSDVNDGDSLTFPLPLPFCSLHVIIAYYCTVALPVCIHGLPLNPTRKFGEVLSFLCVLTFLYVYTYISNFDI